MQAQALTIELDSPDDWPGFRAACRALLAHGADPALVRWRWPDTPSAQPLGAGVDLFSSAPQQAMPASALDIKFAEIHPAGYPTVWGTPALRAALRHVAEAQGMAAVAERAGIPRESLYRALGPKGNPTVKTLLAVLSAAGLHLAVTRQDSAHA